MIAQYGFRFLNLFNENYYRILYKYKFMDYSILIKQYSSNLD